MKKIILILTAVIAVGLGAKNASAQISPSVLFVPLIGITSVPSPLALPNGAGTVTYHYAVKNFLQELALMNVQVVDDTCRPVAFVTGDDNGNGYLDYDETWRYACTTRLSSTTQSTATATGVANGITATHKAYATVVVGSDQPFPLVSIINITKVAYPLSLPASGGPITFTYKVNNPGVVPLSDVAVKDNKCSAMSGKLGDTNGNDLLNTNEVWIYTCTTILKETTTNTVSVAAFANGLQAVDYATLTIQVASSSPGFPAQEIPALPDTGVNPDLKIILWEVLSGILVALIVVLFLTRPRKRNRIKSK